ncbi:MAG: Menaquinone reductase, multiheme cytochrome c subunit [Verrucomicrobiae bacterium]|nr:Menaquinone reductase, multiheme cytochrome c subunit [Verrucomicrobiae bacterium]
MKQILTYILLAGIALTLTIMVVGADRFRLPGNQQDYEPDQPIAYSHRLHAGELGIDCQYCHTGAERSRYAGVPAASTCLNCHKFITATWGAVQEEDKRAAAEKRAPQKITSPEIAKLYAEKPIVWNRIHNLPDFAYFDHRPHVYAGVKCQTCHGPVETMDKVRQFSPLTMGWCVNCHRQANQTGVAGKAVHAPIDCTTCHY